MKKNEYVIRTCIITRKNNKKEDLLRFVEGINGEYIFDEKQKISKRGIYIQKDLNVFQKLFNKYKIELKSSEKVLKILKSLDKKNIEEILEKILENLKNTDYLVYGIDEIIDSIKKNKTKLVIVPSDINSKQVNKIKKIAKIFKTKLIFIKEQKLLKTIFLSDVKLIGIMNKKVIRGILNKMEVE